MKSIADGSLLTHSDVPEQGTTRSITCGSRLQKTVVHQTSARITDDVAEQGARRLGTLAILTAITAVGIDVLQHILQPEMADAHGTPLYRLAVLFLVLSSIGLAALQRAKVITPQALLDLGLVFEVAGAAVIGVIENTLPWPDNPIRGTSSVAAWIALCVLAIPNRPWKSCTAAVLAAGMVPAAHLSCAALLGYAPLPWNRLASYALCSFFIAGWTPFISTRLYRLQHELSRTMDLGSYQLKSLLGKGGMGEVWVARHRLLRREAAVKLIRPDRLPGADGGALKRILHRFEIEAQSIATLRSTHTVALYDFGVSSTGSLYYAMELLQGLDMKMLVDRYGPQSPGRVISFIRQVCTSLEEAHELGMVHRDVKPTNLFICRLGKEVDFVKVLDFGLVKSAVDSSQTQLTMLGETSGTPAFMSPEQVRGADIDMRTDIYALGCVAYYLLTGSLVFRQPTAMATALSHIEQKPELPSARSELPIPTSLERIVMACLEKKPEDRPQSVTELTSLLDACTDIPAWTQANARDWWALYQPTAKPEELA